MSDNPNYYAIIPATVRYDNELKANAKLLYGELTCLTQKTGYCFASNSYFSDLYAVDESTISRWINQLCQKGYIVIEYIYNGKECKERRITICDLQYKCGVLQNNQGGVLQKDQKGIAKSSKGYCKKIKDNNTSNNITSNNNINSTNTKKSKSFEKPTVEEIREYCEERRNNVDPERFYDFYESKGWFVGKTKMKDWKACVRTWEKNSFSRNTTYQKPTDTGFDRVPL